MMNTAFQIDYLKPDDAESLSLLMRSNREIFVRFFPNTLQQNLSVLGSRNYIEKKDQEIAKKEEFTFAIRKNNDQSILGLVILKNIDHNIGEGELAYCLDSDYHGKGITSSCIKQAIDFAFDKIDLKTLKIIAHKTNRGSIGVALKCGFQWKKTIQKAYRPPNEDFLDMELYELYYEG